MNKVQRTHTETPSSFTSLGEAVNKVLDGLTLRARRPTEPQPFATIWINAPGKDERELVFKAIPKRAGRGETRPAKWGEENARIGRTFAALEKRAKLGSGFRRE